MKVALAYDKVPDPDSAAKLPDDWLEEFETMEPAERQYVLDELAGRPDLWEESEVICEY